MFTVFGFYKFQKINDLKKNQKILNNLLINKNIKLCKQMQNNHTNAQNNVAQSLQNMSYDAKLQLAHQLGINIG